MQVNINGVYGIYEAILGMKIRNYRKVGDKYEAYISNKGKFKSLGTHATEEEAKKVILKPKK